MIRSRRVPSTLRQHYVSARHSSETLRSLAIFVLWAASLQVPAALCAADYYVDQTAGSDTNSGLSPSAPWKNAPGMSAYAGAGILRPGDRVFFDRNDTWQVTGGQGIYLLGGVTYQGDSWSPGNVNSGRATIIAAANLDAGVVRFRDHATIPTIFRGFTVDANLKVATGVDINHRYYQPMSGATKRVQDVEVRNVSSRQALGEYKYGIIISNFGGAANAVENVEIINAYVHDVSRDGISLYPGDGVDDRVGRILVRGCEVHSTGQDPDYFEGHGIVAKGWVYEATIENNYVHDVDSSAVFISGPENSGAQRSADNLHIRANILTSQDNNGIIRLYKTGAKDIKIYNNLIFENTSTGGLSVAGNSGSLALLIYGNTFYNTFVDLGAQTAVVQTLEFRNNIVVYPSAQLRNAGAVTAQGNNLLTSTNPGLKDPANKPTGFLGTPGVDLRPNTDGFSLLPGSTALDRGATLAAAYGSSINSITRPGGLAWDIGAYETGSALPLAPPSNVTARVQ